MRGIFWDAREDLVKLSHLIDPQNMFVPGEDAESYPDIKECPSPTWSIASPECRNRNSLEQIIHLDCFKAKDLLTLSEWAFPK